MRHEITSELREIVVNVKLTDETVPVIETSRGWEFHPQTVHVLWTRQNADEWFMTYVELKGVLPKSGRSVNRTFWEELKDLPVWIAEVVTASAPIETRETS